MRFKLLQSETVFEGRVFKVRRDQVELPNGKQAVLDIVEHRAAVTLLPLDEKRQIWFVRQYRHAAGEEVLELPAGVLEAGEDPEIGAQREVREEIGMAAGKMTKLGEFFLAPGYTTEYMHAFLASELKPDPLEMDEDEFLSVEKVPAEEAYRMALQGEIRDAKSLATLMIARPLVFPATR
ncbi:MAG: NUDIX hydrolase [Chloroflexota bacterium]|nr:MAG: NUDIX hydrolase [Chloroflexota bacterium]